MKIFFAHFISKWKKPKWTVNLATSTEITKIKSKKPPNLPSHPPKKCWDKQKEKKISKLATNKILFSKKEQQRIPGTFNIIINRK